MPRELPGFYWDAERNRYFPISSKPKPKIDTGLANSERPVRPLPATSSDDSDRSSKRRRRSTHYHVTESVRSSTRGIDKERGAHGVLCSHIASTSKATRSIIPLLSHATITTFKTTSIDGRILSFLGDSRGWLYSFSADEGRDALGFYSTQGWTPEFNLPSTISSISISGSRCAATSFGPNCKILLQALDTSNVHVIKPGDHLVHDIWTSSLRGSELVLGANKQAVVFKGIDDPSNMRFLKTHSDVFAVQQEENLVYTGSRNGAISRFDLRIDTPKGQNLLDDVFLSPTNSITNLRIVREWQLLVGNIDGSVSAFKPFLVVSGSDKQFTLKLGTYDLRYSRGRTPLMTFAGNVNSWTIATALDVDPAEEFIFASAQDSRIRAWSLRTGELIHPSLSSTTSTSAGPSSPSSPINWITNPFETAFTSPVQALQVAEEKEGILFEDSVLMTYELHNLDATK
ncbi:hypothetical protein SERLADRAFT_439356 [Serpula lacrymans var. lacrymans S7.9]|uniref:WD40 repeat-like protein n=1 Tax=Serpula lacrymans var. lacrymans (strain S7.9) TaxID=578457 RepID=F8NZT1_SERL9|nr:uncharacterized protein SERLADRAFT_439356 [Serpula lacrymans var. lacrymans S7.9]EGO24052.1 hypothetical protein SERLADRAFT_439356 [Serpula lacrymans var. lacrymans S7.9]